MSGEPGLGSLAARRNDATYRSPPVVDSPAAVAAPGGRISFCWMDPLHLLIVEHDPARRRQLSDTLRASGHAVFGVEDGAAAAAALSAQAGAAMPAFDALVLDLSLP
ncbi:MAG: response regulator, partial [Gemmatimonadota bacterium]